MSWRNQIMRRTPGSIVVQLCKSMLLLLCLGPSTVFAAAFSCDVLGATVVTMPASVTVPRDAPNGTWLTPWIAVPQENYFNCRKHGGRDAGNGGVAFRPVSLTKSGLTVYTTRNYDVWNTNKPGVGIIFAWVSYSASDGDSRNWSSFDGGVEANWDGSTIPGSSAGGQWAGYMYGNAGHDDGSPFLVGAKVSFALVKTGPITPGIYSGGMVAEAAYLGDENISYWPSAYTEIARRSISLTPTIINVLACKTPNVTVNLGSYNQSNFTGVGTSSRRVAFNVNLNDCPTGMNSIQYQFIPVNAVLDATNGVLALSSDSTAAGVGLQLKDSSGKALKYNTQYTLASYSSSVGGSYTIPLTANYYQTSESVTPGSANAVLIFTMLYQ
ncbi:pilus assembly protein [Burkholderia gladioli]|nr:pilus assembly protein [Burkholderia gladioli]